MFSNGQTIEYTQFFLNTTTKHNPIKGGQSRSKSRSNTHTAKIKAYELGLLGFLLVTNVWTFVHVFNQNTVKLIVIRTKVSL